MANACLIVVRSFSFLSQQVVVAPADHETEVAMSAELTGQFVLKKQNWRNLFWVPPSSGRPHREEPMADRHVIHDHSRTWYLSIRTSSRLEDK
jgi:hypothetical protein